MNVSSSTGSLAKRHLLASVGGFALTAGMFVSSVAAQTAASPSPAPAASPAATIAAATTTTVVTTTATAAKGDLIATATSAGNFTTLLKALAAANLTATLQKPGPYTVFAPTDAAFAKLPAGTLDNLLKPENKAQLIALLSYHVVEGKFDKAGLAKVDEIKTLEGTEVDIEASSDGKTFDVDEGKTVGDPVEATNGIIHPLDTVLQP